MAGGLLVLLLLPVTRYGWDGNLRLLGDWWHTVTFTTAPNLTNPDNVSLGATFTRWLGAGSAARLLATATRVLPLAVTPTDIAVDDVPFGAGTPCGAQPVQLLTYQNIALTM